VLRRIERVLWVPPVPLGMLIYFVLRLATAGATPMRIFSTAWIATWFVLAVVNWRRGGQILRWLHSEAEDPDTGDTGDVN